MNRIHALLITLVVAAGVTVGGVALSRSGADAATPPATQTVLDDPAITQRSAALDALEADLNKKLATPAPAPRVRTVRVQAPPVAAPRHDDYEGDDDSWEHEEGDDD